MAAEPKKLELLLSVGAPIGEACVFKSGQTYTIYYRQSGFTPRALTTTSEPAVKKFLLAQRVVSEANYDRLMNPDTPPVLFEESRPVAPGDDAFELEEDDGFDDEGEEDSKAVFDYGRAEREPAAAIMLVDSDTPRGKVERAGYVMVEKAGFISKSFEGDGEIYSVSRRIFIMQGNYVYIKMSVGKAVNKNTEFIVYDDSEEVYTPSGDEYKGKYINILGVARVVKKMKTGVYKAKIKRSYAPLKTGLKVKMRTEIRDYHRKVTGRITKRSGSVEGVIMKVKHGISVLHNKNIIYVDKGLADSLFPGTRMIVVRKIINVETSEEEAYHEVGTILILNSMKSSSVAVITSMTEPLKRGDIVRTVSRK